MKKLFTTTILFTILIINSNDGFSQSDFAIESIKNFSTKDVKVLLGPCTSLNDIIVKRIKRKSITLIRKAT